MSTSEPPTASAEAIAATEPPLPLVSLSVPRWRRVAAAAVAIVVLLTLGLVAVAWRNRWHYVYLMPLASRPVEMGTMVAVPVLLGLAARLGLRDPLVWIAVRCAVVATVVACLWVAGLSVVLPPKDRADRSEAVARSSDGRLVVLATWYTKMDKDSEDPYDGYAAFRIRSDVGPLSRESGRDLASIDYPARLTIVAVRFIGSSQIEIWTSDQRAWVTFFDPLTLNPVHTLVLCGDIGDAACWR